MKLVGTILGTAIWITSIALVILGCIVVDVILSYQQKDIVSRIRKVYKK